MKTRTHLRSLCATLMATAASLWMAPAIQVTYQVDMSAQMALGNFNPPTDTVFISGNFSTPDWQSGALTVATNYILTANAGNPNIYEGTFAIDVTPGQWENHQFVINPNNAFTAPSLKWETSVGNRFFQVPNADTNLPVVYWNNVTNASSAVVTPVTFRVDMSVQTALGVFDPITDYVLLAGDWDWNIATADGLTNDGFNVWSITLNITNLLGSTNNYKFIKATFADGDVWEDDGVGPGGARNRRFVLESTAQILPVAFFNNLDTVPSTPVPVTFQVNMAAQMALGNFTEGVNFVVAAGSFNNWDASTFVLTNDPGEPTIYSGTTEILGATNTVVSFQYVIDSVGWEESVGNRAFNLGATAQVLAPVYWNNVDDLGALTITDAGDSQIDVSWTAAPLVRLQMNTNMATAWFDVPETVGASNATVTVTTGETYLRLIGP